MNFSDFGELYCFPMQTLDMGKNVTKRILSPKFLGLHMFFLSISVFAVFSKTCRGCQFTRFFLNDSTNFYPSIKYLNFNFEFGSLLKGCATPPVPRGTGSHQQIDQPVEQEHWRGREETSAIPGQQHQRLRSDSSEPPHSAGVVQRVQGTGQGDSQGGRGYYCGGSDY